jgi:SAM-dependent methyltransferase
MKSLQCQICSGVSYFYYKYEDFFDNPISMYKCINCGHGSHDHKYTEIQFNEIYRQEYAIDYLNEEKKLYLQRQIQYKLDVELLLGIKNFNSIRVLDYGCSSGGYLDAMPFEWDKVGFEINPFHVDYIKNNKKYIQIYDRTDLITGQFDLITMRGVIEHIPEHSKLIEFLKKRLAPGGALYLTATPDFSSVCSTMYKEKWNQVVCPEHIHQFTSTSLSILLARAGLALQSLNHPYIGTPYANWQMDKLHFMENFMKTGNDIEDQAGYKHAFPGNMMSVLYEK